MRWGIGSGARGIWRFGSAQGSDHVACPHENLH